MPAEFAKARAEALALPLSPLLQGRKFQPAQAGDSPAPSFTPAAVPPPIMPPPPWNNDDNSVRIVAFGLHPTNTAVVYAGGSGGLLKSTDAGLTWRTSFDGGQNWRTYLSDDWESQAVNSIAIDPNEPRNIYVGTGTYDNPGTYGGAGLYRSTDDGEHWQLFSGPGNMLANTIIRDVVIDPHTSGIAANTTLYVATDRFATLGGLWKSTDGGETWSLVLSEPCSNPSPLCNGAWAVAIDPSTNPSTLYVADSSGVRRGDGSGNWQLVYASNSNWNYNLGWKIKLSAVAPGGGSSTSGVYLLSPRTGASQNSLRFSTDAGGNWTEIPTACTEQEIYIDNCSFVGQLIDPEVFAVDPSNRNTVLIGTIGLYRTTNAGTNWQAVRKQNNLRDLHVDHHGIAFSQATPGLAYVGNDGGIWKSTQHGAVETWDDLNHNLPGLLLFSVALGQDGSMMAGTMDNGAVFYDAQGAAGVWQIVLGGDGFQALINPTNSDFSYYIINSGSFRRYQRSVPQDADIYPRLSGTPVPCNWSWSLNPSFPSHITAACRPVVRTLNATATSPSAVVWQSLGYGGPVPGDAPTLVREAPNDPNVIYAVKGSPPWVRLTQNAGNPSASATPTASPAWHDVTNNLPSNVVINNVTVDPNDSAVAYLSSNSAIYKTVNYGASWAQKGFPNLIYHDVAIDPAYPNRVFAASDAGVFVSVNGGETWGNTGDGIPRGLKVTGLSFNGANRQLAASTWGRGVYILTVGDVLPFLTPTPSPTPPPPTPSPSPTPTPFTPTPTPTPTPDLPITVALPVATIDSSVVNFTQAVTTSVIDVSNDLVGFLGDFTFDSTVVTFQSPPVTAGGVTNSNSNLFAFVRAGSGPIRTLRVSAFSNDFTPISGSGTLFYLNMVRINSTPGASTALVWALAPNDFTFSDSNLETRRPNTPPGSITIQAATVNISGTVVYCSNPSLDPVPGVNLTLTGSASGSTLSDGSGNYLFSSLASGGSYTITPGMAALSPGAAGINTVDVVATQRHFLILGTPLSGCQLTAADVNGLGGVNTIDVVAIQRFFLGLSTGIANVGKYQFSPASRSYSPLTGNQTAQNYDALIFGDVASGFVHRPEGGNDTNAVRGFQHAEARQR